LAPLEASVWGYERIKEYLSAKVAAKLACKPPEEIKSPPTIIAGPVVMGMIFATQEPHLRRNVREPVGQRDARTFGQQGIRRRKWCQLVPAGVPFYHHIGSKENLTRIKFSC
jgi:hypothetical protein